MNKPSTTPIDPIRKLPGDWLFGFQLVNDEWFSHNKTHVKDYTESSPEEIALRLEIEKAHDDQCRLGGKPN